MPRKKHAPLPESLRYLQPFVNALAKLAPDERNEDVDATRLEAALRKRIRGMDADAVETALEEDRAALDAWLTTTGATDHPAFWVVGYLSLPELAEGLTRPPEPPPRWPTIDFEPPAGWTVKVVPPRLDLKRGPVSGTIMIYEQSFFAHLWQLMEQTAASPDPRVVLTFSEVRFGPCHGCKQVRSTFGPIIWKDVQYLLTVPGGFVMVWLGTRTGADFDETPLESQLHTIRITPPV